MKKARVLLVFGTRPEAIKMAPLVRTLRNSSHFTPLVCVTAQHRQLLDQVLQLLELKPDIDLDLMRPNQDLFELSANCLLRLRQVLVETQPELVLVQGDTATAYIAALAAFYLRIPVGHVEAGLRTNERYSPFPEEIYRRMLTQLSELHFAPTSQAVERLLAENVKSHTVFCTGNTGIDSLRWVAERASRPPWLPMGIEQRQFLLLTAHRRENFGEPLQQIFTAVRAVAERNRNLEVIYPVHPNPNVSELAQRMLSTVSNVSLVPPVEYDELVYLLKHCSLVLTDSGGIQEEAPAFGKPVLILRDTTERQEAVDAGCARLVGTDAGKIIELVEQLLTPGSPLFSQMAQCRNPFGDGTASQQIVSHLERWNAEKFFIRDENQIQGARLK